MLACEDVGEEMTRVSYLLYNVAEIRLHHGS